MLITACDDSTSSSSSAKDCINSGDCSENTSVCNSETGKCEANPPNETKCSSNDDCKGATAKICNNLTGKCVECLNNNDCTDSEKPRCISETNKCEIPAYGKKSCQNNNDCTDAYYSKCNTNIHECTSPCQTSNDCQICKENEKCIEIDNPVCNPSTRLCESYSNCNMNSSEPCYTTCSSDYDEYYAWLNGNLINQKCRDNSCVVTKKEVGIKPDACDIYSTPPESCNPETSAMLCSPNSKSIWTCDSSTNQYNDQPCDAETEHCVQCQNRAACLPIENCTNDSKKNCHSVCNDEGDGYYLWDFNTETVKLHICPSKDCIHVCGTAECKSGTGYNDGEHCDGTFKYCTIDGAFAFTCEENQIIQKACKNNDCVFDSGSNEITSCTVE